jgi:hypothetical protein
LFAFIRHDIVVPVRITDETLATWSDWLARIATSATSADRAKEARA